MKKILAALAIALATGCVSVEDKEPPQTCDAACQQNNNNGNNTNPVDQPELKGSFIAGHLGNYLDCPEEGYSGAMRSDPAGEMGADFAPCEASDETCGGPLNCEGAQFTIRLTNGGVEDALGVQISEIEILSLDGTSLATLPLMDVFDSESNEPFDGTIAAGESVDLRVDFQGPANFYELVGGADSRIGQAESAEIKVTVSADNHEDVLIEGGEVFVLPSVVT